MTCLSQFSIGLLFSRPVLKCLSTLTYGHSHSTYTPRRLFSMFCSFNYQSMFMTPICVFQVPISTLKFRFIYPTACWISAKLSQTWHEPLFPIKLSLFLFNLSLLSKYNLKIQYWGNIIKFFFCYLSFQKVSSYIYVLNCYASVIFPQTMLSFLQWRPPCL